MAPLKVSPYLGSVPSRSVLLPRQLLFQVLDLRLQKLDGLLVVLLGTVRLPLHHLCCRLLALQSLALPRRGLNFLQHKPAGGVKPTCDCESFPSSAMGLFWTSAQIMIPCNRHLLHLYQVRILLSVKLACCQNTTRWQHVIISPPSVTQ